jgi:ABC-type transport system substrate-binding protein
MIAAGTGSATLQIRQSGRKKRNMSSQVSQQSSAEEGARAPAGTVHIVDPHPLNWLYITWNTMEEPVRTDEKGNIVGACMESSHWEGATLVVKIREGVRFQDGTTLTAHSVRRAFDEVQKWKAPHPPGTYLNFHPDTTVDVTDDYTIRFNFPEPDGLALASSGASISRANVSGLTVEGSATRSWGPAKDTGEPSTLRARGARDRSPSPKASPPSRTP